MFPNGSPPASVLQTGRNTTTREQFTMPDGVVVDAAVKRFGKPSWFRSIINRVRGVSSKARRSFAAARFLHSKLPGSTPEPLFADDTIFATHYVPDLVSFKEALETIYAKHGPCSELMSFLRNVAESLAQIHDAGFQHNDLGNQNIFLAENMNCGIAELRNCGILILDLNRSRQFLRPLTPRATSSKPSGFTAAVSRSTQRRANSVIHSGVPQALQPVRMNILTPSTSGFGTTSPNNPS